MEDAGTPTTLGAVIIIAAVLLPGFVTVLMQERTFRSADDATALDRLLRIGRDHGFLPISDHKNSPVRVSA